MPVCFVDKYKEGFEVIIEAVEGEYLLGGRQVDDGAVFDSFEDALLCMNAILEDNLRADRRVRVAKVLPFAGMVSCGELIPDTRMPPRG